MSQITLLSDITVTEIAQLGGDHMVVAAARVSSNGQEALKWADPEHEKSSRGLIRSLVRQRHGTPFEHGCMIFFVHAPIFVFREWHRHRIGFSYNEESGRYKQLEPVFWVPRYERPMVKVEKYKAMSPMFKTLEEDAEREEPALRMYGTMYDNQRALFQEAYQQYEWELEQGIAPEVARRLLPVSIYSSCWVTCNPRSIMNFLSLRTHEPDAVFVSYPQLEIEDAARQVEEAFAQYWPITYEFFNDYGRVGV